MRFGSNAVIGVAAMLAVAVASAGTPPAGPLHVPSPDWRDQVVYFAMIDRFDDGDPANNDQGVGEYDPADNSRYSGGDLRGLARRLDYIQGLGATALWITPPVANQWLNPERSYGGYHGYWASDFSAIDAHYGTLDDYRALSRSLHGRGMYLVQDVVVNHTGDWIGCDAGVAPDDAASVAAGCRLRGDAQGRMAPLQPPFDRNDPRDPDHVRDAIYHFTPAIADYSDRRQELDHALADLDDLNTENPVVRRALRKAYGAWIRDIGVDAFRVDTAFHVPADFFADFLHADDPQAPGMARVAAASGRADFLAFGEGFGSDKPFGDAQARKLDGYMRTPGGLPSMINFPLYGTLGDVFAGGRPPAELEHRIGSMMRLHADPWRMPSFIDNHDVDRFLASGSEAGLKQALLAMLTLPGIPVIYYGTEQGFREQRRAMFAGGFGSGERDHFDADAPLYRYLQQAIALRRDNKVFSRGTPTVLAANPARAGAIAWRMDEAGEAATLVVLNSADHEVLLDALDTGLPAGTRLQGLFAIDGEPRQRVVGDGGRLTLVLPPRGGEVWEVADATDPAQMEVSSPRKRGSMDFTPGSSASMDARLYGHDEEGTAVIDRELEVHGTAPGIESIRLVVDGDLANAQTIAVGEDGHWQARLRVDDMIDPAIEHRVVAYDPATGRTGAAQRFRAELDWQLAVDAGDPADDDTGPTGGYTYPTGPGWREHRPADIERLRVWTTGGALRFELTMRSVSTAWHPTNGFDHVAITAFLQLPGLADGARVMPQQHAELPDGMRWQRRLRAHGWSNALFTHRGADADDEGTPATPVADLTVDHDARTIAFTLPASALDNPASLAGARLHVTTWDYDGGYRPLAPEAGEVTFGGGKADGARVMDAVSVELE